VQSRRNVVQPPRIFPTKWEHCLQDVDDDVDDEKSDKEEESNYNEDELLGEEQFGLCQVS
jgi:hypothetical protein